jgi:ppGpp synthetase/RelA/SpoT-type nucleotidyltranferase
MPEYNTETHEFVDVYREYRDATLMRVEQEIDQILRGWQRSGHWSTVAAGDDFDPEEEGRRRLPIPRPIAAYRTRIKRYESVLDKLQRLSDQFPRGEHSDSLRQMRDMFGARIIVFAPSHLRMVDYEIRHGQDFKLMDDEELKPRSYLDSGTLEEIGLNTDQFDIKGVKPSGYASLHYFVQLKTPVTDENPIFELQTRTMLENVWAEIEHQLGYKPDQDTEFSVRRQFRVLSQYLRAIDAHFDSLYDRLRYLQSLSNPQTEDRLNAENLPQILTAREIPVLQDEIGGLLQVLEYRSIIHVGDLRARLTEEFVSIVKQEYSRRRENDGKSLTAFDFIGTLVTTEVGASSDRIRQAYNDQLSVVEMNKEFRKKQREYRSQRTTK